MTTWLFNSGRRLARAYGSCGLICQAGRSFRRALALMPVLGVAPLVTARFPLAKVEDAFAHATAGRGVKTIITPNEG